MTYDTEITQESADRIRNRSRGRRICISEDGKIFIATLEDIKKHGYCLAGDATESQLGLPTTNKFVNVMKTVNAIIESGENEIKE